MCDLLEYGQTTKGSPIRENFLSQKLLIAMSSSARGGTTWPALLSLLILLWINYAQGLCMLSQLTNCEFILCSCPLALAVFLSPVDSQCEYLLMWYIFWIMTPLQIGVFLAPLSSVTLAWTSVYCHVIL